MDKDKKEKKDDTHKRPVEPRKGWFLFGREVSKLYAARVVASIAAFFTVPYLLLYLPSAQAHFNVIVFGALAVFAAAAVGWAIVHILWPTLKGLLDYKSIVKSCGIEGFHPLTTEDEKEAGWGVCVDRMSEAAEGELCLAVFTGASTFANDEDRRSPLREAIERHRGDLRILLMQKGCEAWEESIKEFGKGNMTEEKKFRIELEDGHDNARKFCETLARKPKHQLRSIEVREYDRTPLWKMVLMGDYVWVQYYVPGERSDDLPAYILRRWVSGGMAYPLQNVFDYRWKMSESRVMLRR